MSSIYPERERSAWIVAATSPAGAGRSLQAPRVLPRGGTSGFPIRLVSSAVILLTNKECPWRCLMCDLWKHTLTRSVPPGAIPRQIDYALSRLQARPEQVKLYNSGSFFDRAAVPLADYPAIAQRVSFASRLVVECHPRLVGRKRPEAQRPVGPVAGSGDGP